VSCLLKFELSIAHFYMYPRISEGQKLTAPEAAIHYRIWVALHKVCRRGWRSCDDGCHQTLLIKAGEEYTGD
jgi:hypothetical protein